jgi:hypothetical protein
LRFSKPKNDNYCATIVQIKAVYPLENCDNIQGTTIFGNQVIVGNDTKAGDIGVFFPPETQLSDGFLSSNNLYKYKDLNSDKTKKGYIEKNGRVRTMKLRGNQSAGIFMPIESLAYLGVSLVEFSSAIGVSFDKVNSIDLCRKYQLQASKGTQSSKKKDKKVKKQSKIVPGQFRFHEDTTQLGKNIHKIDPNHLISITHKLHGTSVVVSKVLCKKKLGIFDKIAWYLGANIITTLYDNLYSSRKVIKNDYDRKSKIHFYKEDVWGFANEVLKEFLKDGMTIYAEIVGFTPNGKAIQSKYDYGCKPKTCEVYIYRITMTNPSGDVFEFSARQVQTWCAAHGLKAVPELYYGKAYGVFDGKAYGVFEWLEPGHASDYNYDYSLDFGANFINAVKKHWVDKQCFMCKNEVPAEGVVVRKEAMDFEAYKLKSFEFMKRETEELDAGNTNMEDDESMELSEE